MGLQHDPFRREADAFRLLLIIGVAAGTVIAVALLIGTLPAALLGLVLACVGAVRAWRWMQEGLKERP